jgi:hypothetical protein
MRKLGQASTLKRGQVSERGRVGSMGGKLYKTESVERVEAREAKGDSLGDEVAPADEVGDAGDDDQRGEDVQH